MQKHILEISKDGVKLNGADRSSSTKKQKTMQNQRQIHNPENGVIGDRMRATLAKIFDLPMDEVPHLAE